MKITVVLSYEDLQDALYNYLSGYLNTNIIKSDSSGYLNTNTIKSDDLLLQVVNDAEFELHVSYEVNT